MSSLLTLGSRLSAHPEILDAPVDDPALLAQSLRDLRRINRWLGGARLSRLALERLIRRHRSGAGHDRALRLVDVGAGLGDIPVALLNWARRTGLPLEIDALDSHAGVIAAATSVYGSVAGLNLRVADARSLPYADGSFDVAHTSLFAHHLEPAELQLSLHELARISRIGVVVNDVNRSLFALVGALLVTRLFTANAITRHDGPLSVRRAYTLTELIAIARGAGLVPIDRVWGLGRYRYAVSFRRSSAGDPASSNGSNHAA